MTHDNFDDLFDDAARSYNAPPATPREPMWDAIARARTAASIIPISSARSANTVHTVRRWAVTAAGIAAALVVGIAIGRVSRGPATTSAVATTTATPKPSDVLPQAADSVSRSRTDVPAATTPDRTAAPTRTRAGRNAAGQGLANSPRERSVDLSGDEGAYRLAVVAHLVRTEVLLTGFRAQSSKGGDATLDAQFATLSRELLATTRMLITRRGGDPALTHLLEDLELVLMQLSQYATDGRRSDLDAVNQSIEKRNVLPKLRSTIPAGIAMSSGT